MCDCAIFSDHTHLLLEGKTKKLIDYIALFGAYCIRLTNVHRPNRYEACNIIKKKKRFLLQKQGP